MKKKGKNIAKIICILLIGIIIYASISSLVSTITKTNTSGLQTDLNAAGVYSGSLESKTRYFSTTNSNYDPDSLELTPDKIIKTAASYLGTSYKLGQKGYSDIYVVPTSYQTILNKTATANKNKIVYGLDCSGLVYVTLRSLGVRLTNFSDPYNRGWYRTGPVPLDAKNWVYNGKEIESEKQVKPFNIKWENGESIAQITDYVTCKHYDETSKTIIVDKTYGEFINENNVAPGSVVIAINEDKSEYTDEAYNHAWLYIGKFETKDDVKTYLKNIGVSENLLNNDSNWRVLTQGETNYWSIESAGGVGVTITNRDPGANMVVDGVSKGGSGYAAFTLVSPKAGSYKLNIVKKSANDTSDLSNVSSALGNAKFEINSEIVTTQDKTKKLVKEVEINAENVNTVDTYTITETEVPVGYEKLDLSDIKINVNKKESENQYIVESVEVYKGETKLSTINSGGKEKININDIDDIELGVELSANGLDVTITAYNKKESYYDLAIFKESEISADWNIDRSIAGATFEIKQYVTNEFKLNKTATVTTNEGKETNITFESDTYNTDKGILLNAETAGKFYRYVIKETTVPNDEVFNLPEWIRSGYNMVIDVTTEQKDTSYVVKQIDVYLAKVSDSGELSDIKTIKEGLLKGENYSDSENNLYINLDNNGKITIGVKNPELEGNYKLNLIKKEKELPNVTDVQNTTDPYIVGNNGTTTKDSIDEVSNLISGATYNIKKYLNISSYDEAVNMKYTQYIPDNGIEKDGQNITTTTELTTMFDNIQITQKNAYDVYIIQEEKAATNYKMDYNIYKLIVSKAIKQDETGYKTLGIDKVEIFKNDNANWVKIENCFEGTNADGSKWIAS